MDLDASYLDPMDPRVGPLPLAIGQVVLGCAALEKFLLLDIAVRSIERDGMRPELGAELARLERHPAGTRLKRLRELGTSDAPADRIADVVPRQLRRVGPVPTGRAATILGNVVERTCACDSR
jgi:hypothetical protein